MKTSIAAALLLFLLLLPGLALGQQADVADVAGPPPVAPEPVRLAPPPEPLRLDPPPPPPLRLAPSGVQPAPAVQQRLSLTGAPAYREPDHSDTGLQVGEYFGALGLHVAMTTALVGIEAMGMLYFVGNGDEEGVRPFMIVSAIVAPLLMNLPPSLVAHRLSKKCGAHEHSWLFTYLSGVAVSSVSVGIAAYLVASEEDRKGNMVATSLILGTLLAPALQVMVLNLTRKPAPLLIAPLLVPGGGGLAVGNSF